MVGQKALLDIQKDGGRTMLVIVLVISRKLGGLLTRQDLKQKVWLKLIRILLVSSALKGKIV